MIITNDLASELVGLNIKEVIFILNKLKGTGFDYPETRIPELREWYKKETNNKANSKSE